MIKLDLAEITCGNQQQAENLLLLLKNCQKLTALVLAVADKFNAEAWAALSKAVKLHPGGCGLSTTRSALLNGRRGDLKTIWEAVRSVEVMYSEAFISDGEVFIEKEEGWARLEQVLDMSEDQWRAEAQKDMEGEEEEEEEDDGGPPAEEADDEGEGDSAEDDGEEEEREAEAKTAEIWPCAGLKLVKVEDGGEDGEERDEDGGELDEGKVLLLLIAKVPPKQLKQEN